MRSMLGVLIAATFAAGLAVVVDDARQSSAGTIIELEERTVVVPPAGQAEISGTIEAATAVDAVAPPLPLPLTVPAGAATVRIDGAIVDGERATIVWDGGRPFHLRGEGTIDLGPTRIEIGTGGVNWPLDGLALGLSPGRYTVDAPVAVGTAGLAAPRDGVAFDADAATIVSTTGGVAVRTAPAALLLEGPGSLTLRGELRVRTAGGTRTTDLVRFGPGPFRLELVPVAGGWHVDGVLRGPLE